MEEKYEYYIKADFGRYLKFIDNKIENYCFVEDIKLASMFTEDEYDNNRVEILDKLIDLGVVIPHFYSIRVF